MKLLPDTFRFSLFITAISIALAALMLCASVWQWQRYQYKRELVATYRAHSTTLPQVFPTHAKSADEFSEVLHRKVTLRGKYDFSHQMIVLNRRHKTGPGYWLLTPFKPLGADRSLIVSRGFIPFSDSTPESWGKYSLEQEVEIDAVVQSTIPHRSFLSPGSSATVENSEFILKWRYPDIEKIANQLPYPLTTAVFLQRLGKSPSGGFPAESVSVRVPPSTHFGYAIEWALLAMASLTVGFLLQAFPRHRNKTQVSATKAIGVLLCGAALWLGPLVEAFATERADRVPQQADIKERLGEKIDLSLRFRDETGKELQLADLVITGRPLILAPVYYECPQLCNLTQTGLVNAVNKLKLQLGTDFSIASLSFNPKEKSSFAAQKAKKYRGLIRCQAPRTTSATERDVRCQALNTNAWKFLTGTEEAINSLMNQVGFSFELDGEEFIHAAVLLVITPDGRLSRYLYGVSFPVENVRLALVEASEGRIGTLVDRALLFCFRYDHIQGKYTLSILTIVRVVCLGFFFALITCLLWLRVKEKRLSNSL